MPKKTTVPDSLSNIVCPETGKVIGFKFGVRLPRYRGNMLSLINGYYVCVDGVEYPQDKIRLEINGKGPRTWAEIKEAVWEHWNFLDTGYLWVEKEGGLAKGTHQVIASCSNFEQYGYRATDQQRVDEVIIPTAVPVGTYTVYRPNVFVQEFTLD